MKINPWGNSLGQAHLFRNGPVKIKFGRICYTCEYRAGKAKSNFVKCEYRDDPVWEKARCQGWQPTHDPRRLSQYEKFIDTKHLLKNQEIFDYYYWTDVKEAYAFMKPPLHINQSSCFVCKHRGAKRRNKVYCNHLSKDVWEKAKCRAWKIVDDQRILDRFRKYMEQSGADVSEQAKWLRHDRNWVGDYDAYMKEQGLEWSETQADATDFLAEDLTEQDILDAEWERRHGY